MAGDNYNRANSTTGFGPSSLPSQRNRVRTAQEEIDFNQPGGITSGTLIPILAEPLPPGPVTLYVVESFGGAGISGTCALVTIDRNGNELSILDASIGVGGSLNVNRGITVPEGERQLAVRYSATNAGTNVIHKISIQYTID